MINSTEFNVIPNVICCNLYDVKREIDTCFIALETDIRT